MARALSKSKQSSRRRPATRGSRKPTRRSSGVAIRTFRAAMNFINARTNYEKMVRVGYTPANFNLSRMLRLLAGIGNPHKKLEFVHIAGTKGKGSTCHMLAAVLSHAGYKTGLYTSPHFMNIRERISIDGDPVSEAGFTRLIAKIAPVVRRHSKESFTFFEVMTAAALLHFANEKVDFAVLETGLGGRLDSTNVVKPEVCGITSISYDHMAQLGNSLEAIAEEKAGIFKPGVPVISAPQVSTVKRVLKAQADKVGCPLRFVGDDIEFSFRFESSRATGPHTRVCMTTPRSTFDHVQVPLLGEHQAHNCGVALGIIDALRERGFELSEQDAIDGLAEVQIRGRLELIRLHPRTVVDGAHNAASIRALMRAIGQNISYDSMVVIFGCSVDKDIDGMLGRLQLGADKVIFTSTGTARSADPHELHQRFAEKSQKMAMVEPDLHDAFRVAQNCVTREDLVCITGSVHLVGRAMKELAEDLPEGETLAATTAV